MWNFTPEQAPEGEDLIGVGADLAPGTLLQAYVRGVFPMHIEVDDEDDPPDPETASTHGSRQPYPAHADDQVDQAQRPAERVLAWFSPDPRGVLLPAEFHASASLRRSMRRFEIRIDTAFEQVLDGCADERRPGAWINQDIRDAYTTLHRMGWAHSVETWCAGELVGGLYGVAIGGLFAAESKFHRRTDASKAAVAGLAELLTDPAWAHPDRIIDVQWSTDHLRTLGVRDMSRAEYLLRLRRALALPMPVALSTP